MNLQKLQKPALRRPGENGVLCLDAGEYEGVSLFAMKLYEYLPDSASEKQGFLRVIAEGGSLTITMPKLSLKSTLVATGFSFLSSAQINLAANAPAKRLTVIESLIDTCQPQACTCQPHFSYQTLHEETSWKFLSWVQR